MVSSNLNAQARAFTPVATGAPIVVRLPPAPESRTERGDPIAPVLPFPQSEAVQTGNDPLFEICPRAVVRLPRKLWSQKCSAGCKGQKRQTARAITSVVRGLLSLQSLSSQYLRNRHAIPRCPDHAHQDLLLHVWLPSTRASAGYAASYSSGSGCCHPGHLAQARSRRCCFCSCHGRASK